MASYQEMKLKKAYLKSMICNLAEVGKQYTQKKAKTMNLERNIKVKSTFNGVYLFKKPLSKIDAKNHYIYKLNEG